MENKKEKIEEFLNRGVAEILPSRKRLEKLLLSNKKIKAYQGFDPSMPNLHLGNLVGILKLRQLQELGHQIIFLIGDFTGMIGDPTDKSAARQKLSRKEVLKNTKNWKSQVSRFLSFSGKNPVKIEFNSKWQDNISFKELIEISSYFTVQQMIQRDFFQKRIKDKKPIYLHEFLYPVAQAIDCVKMDVDLEIGGSDQTFNMLAGRTLMKSMKNKEKFVLTTKLLVDKKGKKVGKTSGNALFLNNLPDDMFGKIMNLPDETIIPGFELLTFAPMEKIKVFAKKLKQKTINPIKIKKELAFEIVSMNYNKATARKSLKEFEHVFKKKELPSKIPIVKVGRKSMSILDIMVKTKLASSKSDAKRLILQKSVKIDGKVQNNWKEEITIKKDMIVQKGKKSFVKLS